MNNTCVHCRWWKKISSVIGECRRMPPHPADNVTDPRWWPATHRADWCGEFRRIDQPAQSDPKCWMCERTDGELREQSDGGGYESPTLVCHGCFTPQDTGPTFDDLPVAQSEGE